MENDLIIAYILKTMQILNNKKLLATDRTVDRLPITCCIMSWKSPKTLEATLQTYFKENLFDFFDEVIILFQEVSADDVALATKYGLRYISTDHNIGIYGGMKLLAESAQNDYVLLLENDCILIEPNSIISVELNRALTRLQNREVDVYRLRHRWQPGEKFDTVRKFKAYHQPQSWWAWFKAFMRPFKKRRLIGTAPYVLQDVSAKRYLIYIQRQIEGDFIVDSAVLPWTNQSVLCRQDWLLTEILPYVEKHPSKRSLNGFQDVERALNCRWWRHQNFKIGLGLGLFSHERLDF